VRIKSQRDFWAGLLFVIAGLAFAWGATYYSIGQSSRPGPGYFPLGLGILLAILGAIVLFKAMTIEADGGDPVGRIAWRPLLIVLGSLALFAFLLPRVGMLVALPILVVTSALAGDEFHVGEALANAAILTIGSWLVFIKGLGLTIPVWPPLVG
jgi:hypothetical protein